MLDDDGSYFSPRDIQPEIFDREDRDKVAFDNFDDYGKCADQFKKSLVSFKDGDVKNSFFDAVTYSLMFKLTEERNILRERVQSVLGENFYKDFCES